MSSVVVHALQWGALWGAADFLSQFYGAHKEAAARRARGEARTGERPSGAAMMAMVDQPRLLQNVVFGAVTGPLCGLYAQKIALRIAKNTNRFKTSLYAYGMQQLLLAPVLLWSYFNAMTAARGGLTDSSFLAAHSTDAHGKFNVKAVEMHIFDVMAAPLLASWGIFGPIYLMAYFAPFRGMTFLSGCLLLPWCAYVSHTQSTDVL